jgi:hypothetical protein
MEDRQCVPTLHAPNISIRYVQKSPTKAHKLFHNSLFLKFPYTYFGGLNRHLQGVIEIHMHRPYSYYIYGYIIYVEYEWADIVHFVQNVN